MNTVAWVVQYGLGGSSFNAGVGFYQGGTLVGGIGITVSNPNPMSDTAVNTALDTAIATYASGQGWTLTDTIHSIPPKVAIFGGQGAIADTSTGAPTNLNILTTLLGTLTGQVNSTNTQLNDVCARFNTLLAELRTAKVILP